jgi:cytochrome P450
VNESLTFFLAGTITQAITIANTIYYIVQNPAIEKRVRDSLCTNFSTFGDPNASLE